MRIISLLVLLSLAPLSWGEWLIEPESEDYFQYQLSWNTAEDQPVLASFTLELNEADLLTEGDSFAVEMYNAYDELVGTDSYVTKAGDTIYSCNCIDIDLPPTPVASTYFTIKLIGISGTFDLDVIRGFILGEDNAETVDGVWFDPNPTEPGDGEIHPEVDVTYQPEFPALGVYSLPDVCGPQHDASSPTVILGDGLPNNREALADAVKRLETLSNGQGGIIQVPWDADTIQCDYYQYTNNDDQPNGVMPITLSGVLGPNGEQPRFYCRNESEGGTIPTTGRTFFDASLGVAKPNPRVRHIVMENIHVDGYNGWVNLPNAGSVVLRNNYLHSSVSDGIKGVGIQRDQNAGFGGTFQMCGNEMSHAGYGNLHHCLYMAGNENFLTGTDMGLYVTFVDNFVHSCNGNSGYKSTIRNQIIANNRFKNTHTDDPATEVLEGEPTLPVETTGYLVDVIACADSNEIYGNYFYKFLQEGENVLAPVTSRNRRQLYGCNEPYSYMVNPDVDPNVAAEDTIIPDPDGADTFWNPDWWNGLGGNPDLSYSVHDNIFVYEGDQVNEKQAIGSYGTYPNKRWPNTSAGQYTCLLAPPYWDGVAQWFERSEMLLENNMYRGFDPTEYYLTIPPDHSGESVCGYPLPQPDLRDYDAISVVGTELNFPSDIILPSLTAGNYVKLNDVSDGCTGPELAPNKICGNWAGSSYSGFTCDEFQCWGMGGGHNSTQTDQVFRMPYSTMQWEEEYSPTACGSINTDANWYLNEAEMLAANPGGLATWVNRTEMSITYNNHKRPLPFHSYDNIVVLGDYLYEFNLNGRESSVSACANPNTRTLTDGVGEKKSFRYNIWTQVWEMMDYGWGAEVDPATFGPTAGATAVGDKIYIWGKEGISVVDPTNPAVPKTWKIDGVVRGAGEPSIDYPGDGDNIYAVSYTSGIIQFSSYSIANNVVTAHDPVSCTFSSNPQPATSFPQRGYVWDAQNNVMGKVWGGKYLVFDYVNNRCGKVEIDSGNATTLGTGAHAADIVQDNLYIFANGNQETYAYRIPDITGLVVWE